MKKRLQLIKELYQQKKLRHLSVIINDIQVKMGCGGYYGYGKYGYGRGYSSYGYGYGYGDSSGYYEHETKPGFFQRLGKKLGIRKRSKKSRK
ncbi:MAG: hypothetical protein IPP79_21170 [Chitinophagaceae bacterium]|nr:hypothetical protein [Chitinophagaceae bacterium]